MTRYTVSLALSLHTYSTSAGLASDAAEEAVRYWADEGVIVDASGNFPVSVTVKAGEVIEHYTVERRMRPYYWAVQVSEDGTPIEEE